MQTIACALLILAAPDLRQDPEDSLDRRIGLRVDFASSFGEPANDIIGGMAYVSHNLEKVVHEQWWASLELYASSFDFENPGDQVLGTSGTPTADAKIEMQSVSLSVEWHPLDRASAFDFHLGGGFGVVFLGDGDARSLPQVDVDVEGSTGFELHLTAGLAVRVHGPLYLTTEVRLKEIFAGFDVRDRATGRNGSLDSWESLGISFGVEVRF